MTQAAGITTTTYALPLGGATTIPWRYLSGAHHIAQFLTATGATVGAILTHGPGFTVAPTGDTPELTGLLTLLAAIPPTATQLRLTRVTTDVQLYDAPDFNAGVEAQLDRITLALQELRATSLALNELTNAVANAGGFATDAQNSAAAALISQGAAQTSALTAATNAALLGIWRDAHTPGATYALGDRVSDSGNSYYAKVAHVAGVFATDILAGRWGVVALKGAAGVGSGDVVAANNGSEFASKPLTRQNLGLQIGVDVQAYSVKLANLAALTLAVDKLIYPTAANSFATLDFKADARTFIAAADFAAMRAAIGLVIGTHVQTQNATLQAIATGGVTVAHLAAAAFVTAGETIAANDNDTSWPSNAAVIDYVADALAGANAVETTLIDDFIFSGQTGYTFAVNGDYDWYEVALINVTTSTTTTLALRTSVDGISYDTGSTAYTASTNYAATATAAQIPLFSNVQSSGSGVTGRLRITRQLAGEIMAMAFEGSLTNGTGALGAANVHGHRTASATISHVLLFPLAGNIASGKIKIWGVKVRA